MKPVQINQWTVQALQECVQVQYGKVATIQMTSHEAEALALTIKNAVRSYRRARREMSRTIRQADKINRAKK